MKLFFDKRTRFPDPLLTRRDGLVAIGDDLEVETLLEAYSFGIFPWPQEEDVPVLWFSPMERGVLDFSEFHISRSLKKLAQKSDWVLKVNTDFESVIQRCAQVPRSAQDGTWITRMMIQGYLKFHRAGYAHSIECWEGEELVGGLYGVFVGGVFSGESMFYSKDNASKYCLWFIQRILESNGLKWMDIQMVTNNVRAFGGKYISKIDFLKRIEDSKVIAKPLKLPIGESPVSQLSSSYSVIDL
ncbi:MAG: leucyl/phenylalanyl-tRNA--protein transferase [Bdellovibrionales bacterium]|nr:leucyl/phenylalanyl-tRNA--protein transferase [Bdellovibrionales bacterium]